MKHHTAIIIGIICILTIIILLLLSRQQSLPTHEYCLEDCSRFSSNNQQYQLCYTECTRMRGKYQDPHEIDLVEFFHQ